MNSSNTRKPPADATTAFIKPRWVKLVLTDEGISSRYYKLRALSVLKNALRSGDVWVEGSRQFNDFDEYLVPGDKFATLKLANELPLAVATDCDQYLHDWHCWGRRFPLSTASWRLMICRMPSLPSPALARPKQSCRGYKLGTSGIKRIRRRWLS